MGQRYIAFPALFPNLAPVDERRSGEVIPCAAFEDIVTGVEVEVEYSEDVRDDEDDSDVTAAALFLRIKSTPAIIFPH